MHGGTFTLKSTVRIGTEVTVTFPSERVMEALPAIASPATSPPDMPLPIVPRRPPLPTPPT